MIDPAHSSVPPMTTDHVHEESDVAIRPLATFLVSLVVGIAVVATITAITFSVFLATTNTDKDEIPVIAAPEEPFTAPELQVLPQQDLKAFRANEAEILDSTAWVDRNHGVVRIPITRAIDLVAERGFPDWPKMDVAIPHPVPGPDGTLPANNQVSDGQGTESQAPESQAPESQVGDSQVNDRAETADSETVNDEQDNNSQAEGEQ